MHIERKYVSSAKAPYVKRVARRFRRIDRAWCTVAGNLVRAELGEEEHWDGSLHEVWLLYGALALSQDALSLADVHDAWAVDQWRTNPGHPSIRPFAELSGAVAHLDDRYLHAIRAVQARLQAVRGHKQPHTAFYRKVKAMRASAWGNGRLAWLTSGVAQFVLPLASVILAALNLDLAAGVLVLVSAVVTGGLGELRKRSSGPMFGLTSLREDVVEAEITTASGVSTFEDLVDRVHSAVDFWAPALGKHGAALKIDDEDLSRALEAPREATLTERWAVYDNDRYLDQMAFHTRRLLGDRRAAWWWRLGIRALVAVFVFTTAVGIVALITHAASLLGVAAPIGAALYAGWSGLSLAGEQTWLADYWQECLQAFSRCKPPQNREEGAFRTWVLRFERAHREARGRWSAYRGQPQRLEIRD